MDIHQYNKEADDIDEIQAEDRQERMAKEKAKRSHINYLLNKEKTANAEIANNSQQESVEGEGLNSLSEYSDSQCPPVDITQSINKASLEVEG